MTPSTPLRLPARSVCEDYDLDRHDMPRTLLGILVAGLGAAILTLLAWKILKTTSLPAFANSEQTKALATAGAVITSHLESMLIDARQEIARSVEQVESAVGVDERGNAGELAV